MSMEEEHVEEKKVDENAVEVTVEDDVPENPVRDVSAVLGVATAICSTVQEESRNECWSAIEPLESDDATPEDAVDVLANILIQHGPAGAKEVVRSMNKILEEAKKKAEPELRKKGKLEFGKSLW